MWIARNKNGELRIFEEPPRRYHEGPMLDSSLVGFNDAISVGNDEYSFWAVQEFFQSNRIDDRKLYGISIMTERVENGKKVWYPYVPECVKELTWEDEPIEIEIQLKESKNPFMKRFINDTIVITDPCYMKESHPEMKTNTIYGDWSCMVYPGKLEEDTLHQQWDEKYFEFYRDYNNPENASRKEEIGKEYDEFMKKWQEEHLLGRFCADAGEVGVFIWNKLSEKDQKFVRDHPWCCTVISDFTGTVEFYNSDPETRHVIGKGNKPFFSVQSGL